MSLYSPDFTMPENLSPDGQKAYWAIIEHLKTADPSDHLSAGGCKTFYSPQEWKDREEDYGTSSVLIVVYDGGDLRPFFNLDAAYDADCLMVEYLKSIGKFDPATFQPYQSHEKMRQALDQAGFYAEECTQWFSAVYSKTT